MLERTIVRLLRIIREAAGRQFPAFEMIAEAIATGSFFRTRLKTAIAVLLILLYAIFRIRHSASSK